MKIHEAYNIWSEQYDTNLNKTRDLEAKVLKDSLGSFQFEKCLEIGCGTGKNTSFLAEICKQITAIDFSESMLSIARKKIVNERVQFYNADINDEWTFIQNDKFDIVTFSLVLEHIQDIHAIFEKVHACTEQNAIVYIGEYHPFKQYSGGQARFQNNEEIHLLETYTHHISDFTSAAAQFGYSILALNEIFDSENRLEVPRILSILFQKK